MVWVQYLIIEEFNSLKHVEFIQNVTIFTYYLLMKENCVISGKRLTSMTKWFEIQAYRDDKKVGCGDEKEAK